jgi:hypothetical protein
MGLQPLGGDGTMSRISKRLRETAYHEASHAVIARVLTLDCGGASIVPDYVAGEAGHSITADPWACINEWEKRGKVRGSDNAMWHARIMSSMAGAEGEVVLLGSTHGGDGDDRYQIDLIAEQLAVETDWVRLEVRLRAMTRMLVRRHRALIERVAQALIERTTLNREELDELVGRSVDDVKVNAPFLLAMHRMREIERKIEEQGT